MVCNQSTQGWHGGRRMPPWGLARLPASPGLVASVLVLGYLLLLAGCTGDTAPQAESFSLPLMAPLAVQQAKAYPETVTGGFISLADFENVPSGAAQQVECFGFGVRDGASLEEAYKRLVVNTTRTGAGAMEVCLPPHASLVYTSPQIHDFTGYSLLSVSLYSETTRDDLRITLTTGNSSWYSLPTLIQPGWNTVLIDIRRIIAKSSFDITSVRTLQFEFVDALGAVTFNIDDIMLIENSRTISPTPPGVVLQKNALDYRITLPHHKLPVDLAQDDDGLWRLGEDQASVQLASEGRSPAGIAENLWPMGLRRVGAVEVLENNPLRLRIANTWYFPTRAGEWASLAVRKIRWEYTFYGDGRWVTHLEYNNAGGQAIDAIRLRWAEPVALAGDSVIGQWEVKDLKDVVRRWSYLSAGPNPDRIKMQQGYLWPGRIERSIAAEGFAPGDADRDGFDESQGCYYLRAKAGRCRFAVVPVAGDLYNPTFRIEGKWKEPPSVSSEGLVVREVVLLEDGSILFQLKGSVAKRRSFEVVGSVALWQDE